MTYLFIIYFRAEQLKVQTKLDNLPGPSDTSLSPPGSTAAAAKPSSSPSQQRKVIRPLGNFQNLFCLDVQIVSDVFSYDNLKRCLKYLQDFHYKTTRGRVLYQDTGRPLLLEVEDTRKKNYRSFGKFLG